MVFHQDKNRRRGKVEKGIPSLLKSHYSFSHRNGSAATNLSKVASYWKRTNVFAKRQFSLLAKSSESAGWLCTQLILEKRGEQRFLNFSQSRCYYTGCISHCLISWDLHLKTIRSYPMLRTKYGCGISTSWGGRGQSRPTLTNRWFIFDTNFVQNNTTTSFRKCRFPNILRVSRILYCHL